MHGTCGFIETDEGQGAKKVTNSPLASKASPSRHDSRSKIPPSPEQGNLTGEDLLQRRLYETSKLVVKEGEKNIAIALEVEKLKEALKWSQLENEQIKQALLQGINGGVTDIDTCANISMMELLRLRLQECEDGNVHVQAIQVTTGNKKMLRQRLSPDPRDIASSDQTSAAYGIPPPSRASCRSRDESTERLKNNITKMTSRSRRDREIKLRLEKDVDEANNKVDALSDHIEKLMVHLKHEAITKAKALTERTRCQKEIETLKKKLTIMEKRNNRKDQAISDLKEGGKVLEDQLTLMDEKYMELRMKLDWTRAQTEKIVKRKDEELRELNSKLLLMRDLVTERGGKKRVRSSTKYSIQMQYPSSKY